MSSIELAHHDGSALYVDNQAPDLGDKLNVWARVPAAGGARQVYVRFIQDGEARFVEASLDRTSRDEQWWRANVELRNPVTGYRFLLRLASGGYRWLNGSGVHAHDVTDAEDFRPSPSRHRLLGPIARSSTRFLWTALPVREFAVTYLHGPYRPTGTRARLRTVARSPAGSFTAATSPALRRG